MTKAEVKGGGLRNSWDPGDSLKNAIAPKGGVLVTLAPEPRLKMPSLVAP